jgi:hypothetical protein
VKVTVVLLQQSLAGGDERLGDSFFSSSLLAKQFYEAGYGCSVTKLKAKTGSFAKPQKISHVVGFHLIGRNFVLFQPPTKIASQLQLSTA